MLIRIYNENKQAEQGKLQNVNFEGKKRVAGSGMELNPVELNGLRNGIESVSGELRVRSHPAISPTCEMDLKKSLEMKVEEL